MNLTSAPRFFCAHCTPSQADWLKLLSSTLPTSVTRPTRSFLAPAAAGWFGQPDSGAPAATGAVPATGLAAGEAAGLATALAAGLAAGAAGLAAIAGLAAAAGLWFVCGGGGAGAGGRLVRAACFRRGRVRHTRGHAW